MAVYGRLDVYWPNGPIENFALEKTEIGIGRLPGNDIVLDTTTLSRYHVKISHTGGQVSITDLESINGTYVDGVRLNLLVLRKEAASPIRNRKGVAVQVHRMREHA